MLTNILHALTLIILISVTVLLVAILVFAKKFKALRKSNPTHLLIKLNNVANRKVAYECICGKGGNIYLGRAFVRVIDLAILILLTLSIFSGARIPLPVILLLSLLILGVYIPLYISLYKKMRASKHSKSCSRIAAIHALPYQTQGSWFEIRKP